MLLPPWHDPNSLAIKVGSYNSSSRSAKSASPSSSSAASSSLSPRFNSCRRRAAPSASESVGRSSSLGVRICLGDPGGEKVTQLPPSSAGLRGISTSSLPTTCASATFKCGLPSARVLTCRKCSTAGISSHPCSRHSQAAMTAPDLFFPIWQFTLTLIVVPEAAAEAFHPRSSSMHSLSCSTQTVAASASSPNCSCCRSFIGTVFVTSSAASGRLRSHSAATLRRWVMPFASNRSTRAAPCTELQNSPTVPVRPSAFTICLGACRSTPFGTNKAEGFNGPIPIASSIARMMVAVSFQPDAASFLTASLCSRASTIAARRADRAA
mmetsp:Transcript_30775/g.64573  ORF Transcript_30775/g.64573 Transcript_30775/m.64573 type:complete len:324 (+) Transcript_30775:116-1087(+)